MIVFILTLIKWGLVALLILALLVILEEERCRQKYGS